MDIPKLRFKGFSDKWISKSVSDYVSINPKTGKIPDSFIYIDLESVKSGALLKENEIRLSEAPSRAQRVLSKGDILFQMVRPYQGNNLLFEKEGIYVASTGYAQIKTNESNQFFYQLFHTKKFLDEVMDRCTGTSYPAIDSKSLGGIKVSAPGMAEQQKIASFLAKFDQKISLLSKKHELLIQYKKGVMQKIFSQEIRFKDKVGNDFPEWEQVRVGSLGKFIGGGTPSTKNPDLWSGDIPWISSSDISEGSISEIRITRYISPTAIQESAAKLVPKNSVLIVSRVGVGKIAIASEDMCTSQDFTNLVLSSANAVFVAYLLKFHSAKLLEFNQGTSIKGFVKADLEALFIPLPHIDEQGMIAAFLSAIDEAVKNIKSKLEFTKQYKQGLLQQMFI